MEPIGHDAREVDVLNESDLIDRLLGVRGRLRRAKSKISEDAREVRPELALDKLRVNLGIEIFHVKQVDLAERRLGHQLRVGLLHVVH